CISYAGSNVFF
nr:immunoglobulin light chain junction region [Macaca mulatta]MPO04477.1 immunoglobulin light chain junction region [Macaca mulatta]MPO04483.1 immunoglobulin light chain junction region [Macaca mulatta]MPO04609.1 immunoglobulin light chain junction region [Macaca mulatta]MPO05108.1 immunoglobulin light chain junction region [Macaca mulatta]